MTFAKQQLIFHCLILIVLGLLFHGAGARSNSISLTNHLPSTHKHMIKRRRVLQMEDNLSHELKNTENKEDEADDSVDSMKKQETVLEKDSFDDDRPVSENMKLIQIEGLKKSLDDLGILKNTNHENIDDQDIDKAMPLTKEDIKYIERNFDRDNEPHDNIEPPDPLGDNLKDDRRDVPPPNAMVAGQMKHIQNTRIHPNPPSQPEMPSENGKQDEQVSALKAKLLKLNEENYQTERRVANLLRERMDLKGEMQKLTKEIEKVKESAKAEIDHSSVRLENSKKTFQTQLESAAEEHRNEIEELKNMVEQQKKAFDELLEEKQILSRVLSDEQETLTELQDKIQHPDLGLWIRQRAKKAALLIDTPETDAMKFYASKYMAPKVQKLQHKLQVLEKRVEHTVDHLLPTKYGSFVAFILSIGLIGFPTVVTLSMLFTISKSVSMRQYVLLGNIFLATFAGGICLTGLFLRQDPLQTLYEASEGLFMTLQIATAFLFLFLLGVILMTLWYSRNIQDFCVFGCEFIFYVLVAANYHGRVWKPAFLGQNIETNAMMYAIYFMDFVAMTILTTSSSQTPQARLPILDEERGDIHKTNSNTKNTSVGSSMLRPGGMGSLGTDIIRAVSGQPNGLGKDA